MRASSAAPKNSPLAKARKKVSAPPPQPPVVFNQTIPADTYAALVRMRKAEGISSEQELVRILVTRGLKQNDYLPNT